MRWWLRPLKEAAPNAHAKAARPAQSWASRHAKAPARRIGRGPPAGGWRCGLGFGHFGGFGFGGFGKRGGFGFGGFGHACRDSFGQLFGFGLCFGQCLNIE